MRNSLSNADFLSTTTVQGCDFLPVDMDLSVSAQVHKILSPITYRVERVGFDESFLDVSCARKIFGTPQEIARTIRKRILQELISTPQLASQYQKQLQK